MSHVDYMRRPCLSTSLDRKALCMSGYNVDGSPLYVFTTFSFSDHIEYVISISEL